MLTSSRLGSVQSSLTIRLSVVNMGGWVEPGPQRGLSSRLSLRMRIAFSSLVPQISSQQSTCFLSSRTSLGVSKLQTNGRTAGNPSGHHPTTSEASRQPSLDSVIDLARQFIRAVENQAASSQSPTALTSEGTGEGSTAGETTR